MATRVAASTMPCRCEGRADLTMVSTLPMRIRAMLEASPVLYRDVPLPEEPVGPIAIALQPLSIDADVLHDDVNTAVALRS